MRHLHLGLRPRPVPRQIWSHCNPVTNIHALEVLGMRAPDRAVIESFDSRRLVIAPTLTWTRLSRIDGRPSRFDSVVLGAALFVVVLNECEHASRLLYVSA